MTRSGWVVMGKLGAASESDVAANKKPPQAMHVATVEISNAKPRRR
jgi:hypothetical protein